MCISFFIAAMLTAQPSPPPAFEQQTIDSTVSIGYGVALGDVDGDGKPDILLADKKQIRWYRNGDWQKFVMAENLTKFDNVCIAARDIDGDGKVEVAVGAQWNPGETSDSTLSGSVHYLVRPADPTQRWEAVTLPHEPTVHRMRWMKRSDGKYYLVVLPLHGRGNKLGEGAGVRVLAYEYPADPRTPWPIHMLSSEMHLTHNLAINENKNGKTEIFVAGKEGIRKIDEHAGASLGITRKLPGIDQGSGEVSVSGKYIAAIQPMHGHQVVVYSRGKNERHVLDSTLQEGHGIALADFLGSGEQQVVAGWRNPDQQGNTGIRMYIKKPGREAGWETHWIDKNGIACEDLQVMDMNADGKPDIVAAGRSTGNLKIYWNRN